jgi:RimJ/RimL family protein N-acetyltransferase
LEYPEFKSVIVITGAAYEHKERLKDVLNQNDVITYYHAIDENNMADLMAEADVAIVPASGILLEALASGCKVVSGMYSDNQKFLFDEYKSLKAFYSAEDFSQENIVYGLNNVMKKQLILNETILDGNSHARLLKLFKQLQTEDQVLLRKIEQKDLLRTYEWASDPEIRKFFFNPEVIGLTDHKKWFNRKLKDQNCFYYLGFINNKAFGSIRFDIQEHKTYVSYLIDPKYQNRGLGSIILKKALHLFVNSTAYNLTIYAEVFLQNHASARVFEKLGFAKELASPNDDILVFKKRIKN